MREKFNFIFKISITVLIATVAIISINKFKISVEQESISSMSVEDVETVLNEALVACYAVEGAYPDSIKYLKNYGIVFDDEKYKYEYNVTNSYELPELNVSLR